MEKMTTWVRSGDLITFFFLNRRLRSTVLDNLMPLLTHLGGAVWSIFLSVMLLLSSDPFWHKLGIRLSATLLVSHLIVVCCKKMKPRLRPYQVLENVFTASKLLRDASFPSGHSTAAFATASVLSAVLPEFALIWFGFALLVAVSRVYLGLHYPSDIAIGALLGMSTAWLMA